MAAASLFYAIISIILRGAKPQVRRVAAAASSDTGMEYMLSGWNRPILKLEGVSMGANRMWFPVIEYGMNAVPGDRVYKRIQPATISFVSGWLD